MTSQDRKPTFNETMGTTGVSLRRSNAQRIKRPSPQSPGPPPSIHAVQVSVPELSKAPSTRSVSASVHYASSPQQGKTSIQYSSGPQHVQIAKAPSVRSMAASIHDDQPVPPLPSSPRQPQGKASIQYSTGPQHAKFSRAPSVRSMVASVYEDPSVPPLPSRPSPQQGKTSIQHSSGPQHVQFSRAPSVRSMAAESVYDGQPVPPLPSCSSSTTTIPPASSAPSPNRPSIIPVSTPTLPVYVYRDTTGMAYAPCYVVPDNPNAPKFPTIAVQGPTNISNGTPQYHGPSRS
ncbi:hypothetical protein CC1G_09644 [Coprinopsis cinerea okayama7|uniref:Uncharacterized protein n=1 Tax=Coprinopsis cinerea (strain Okayama-7 / 130 / ATCC MYA-4618 / FGSC 9003) TaxID=240176 RepID=A8P9C6_COPC7|nr:hypothetical protein CC1G_09644 [Coprinopsis cinerea okayama7\|eukprot:XP_001839741.1 hypothetical protein CC1G_09644 [Coprinopsis cinerea okayama7\